MLFTETVTVYNKVVKDKITTWNRSVLTHCNYLNDRKIVVDTSGTGVATQTYVRILAKYNADRYKPPTTQESVGYYALTDFTDHWTLNIGDIVVQGEVADELPQYDSGNNLLKKYAGRCFTVKSIKDNTMIDYTKEYDLDGLTVQNYWGGN